MPRFALWYRSLPVLWQLSTPRDNPLGPTAMAGALSSVRSAMTARDRVTLCLGSHERTVGLYCRATGPVKKLLSKEFAASYPDLSLTPVEEGAWEPPADKLLYEAQLHLAGDLFPIASLVQFDDQLTRDRNDPIAGLLNVVAGRSVDDWSRIMIDIAPASYRRTLQSRRVADRYFGTSLSRQAWRGKFFVHNATSPSSWRRCVARGAAAIGYPMVSRFQSPNSKAASFKGDSDQWLVSVTLQVAATEKSAGRRRLQELASSFARVTATSDAEFQLTAPQKRPRGFLLTCDELALLWHPPTVGVRTQRQQSTGSRQLQPPPQLPRANAPGFDGAALGDVCYGERNDEVALSREDRRKHLYIVGKTGVGKSTVVENLVYQDLLAKRGVGVFDPHGELIDNILERIPTSRTNCIELFDPAGDTKGFNPLECPDPLRRDLVASGFVGSLSKLFDLNASATPRLLYILRNNVMALLEQDDPEMLDVMRMLSDDGFRRRVTNKVSDPVVREFWSVEFAGWTDRYRQEALPAIQNKLGQLLTSKLLRRVFEKNRRSLDLRQIMDRQQVLLVNGSQGKLGQDNTAVLMALLVSSLEQAALARADVAAEDRPDFYLYCDEFQTYAGTDSYEVILSQARKYRLCLTLSHQYLSQITEQKISDAVFGNVGSLCVMRVGREDAERLAREMSFENPPELRPEDLLALPKHRAMVSLSLYGEPQRPFSMATRPPVPASAKHAQLATLLHLNRKKAARRATKRHSGKVASLLD